MTISIADKGFTSRAAVLCRLPFSSYTKGASGNYTYAGFLIDLLPLLLQQAGITDDLQYSPAVDNARTGDLYLHAFSNEDCHKFDKWVLTVVIHIPTGSDFCLDTMICLQVFVCCSPAVG